MAAGKELEEIKQALKANRLFITVESGFQKMISANCPKDGAIATVHTTYTTRGAAGPEITGVRFRCTVCGHTFTPKLEEMVLR